jgi:hypothetical protein
MMELKERSVSPPWMRDFLHQRSRKCEVGLSHEQPMQLCFGICGTFCPFPAFFSLGVIVGREGKIHSLPRFTQYNPSAGHIVPIESPVHMKGDATRLIAWKGRVAGGDIPS